MTVVRNSLPCLTMVIPTKNRSTFLERLLNYFGETGFKQKIIIADSSEKEYLDYNKNIIQNMNSTLNISHEIYNKDIDVKEKIFLSLSQVTTPFVQLGADDDFFVPNTLDLAVDFLQRNPDFSVVGGEPLIFYLNSSECYGKIKYLGGYPQKSIEDNNPATRLSDHLLHYASTWYFVHRTEQLREYWNYLNQQKIDLFFLEFLPSCLSVIGGKYKKLDNLYMVRQYGAPSTYNLVSSRIEWASDPSFESQYILFRNILCEYLLKKSNIDHDSAKKVVNKSFLLFLIPTFYREYNQELKKTKNKNIDFISTVYSSITNGDFIKILQELKVRTGLDWLINKYRIYKLCRKSSPFYHDLKPIIDSIECEIRV